MSRRNETRLAFALLVAAGVTFAYAVLRDAGSEWADPRRSSYLTTPAGMRGWADALERLGVEVGRSRGTIASVAWQDTLVERTLFVVADPTFMVSESDALELHAFTTRGWDLLLAGYGTHLAMRCFGYGVEGLRGDSIRVRPRAPGSNAPWTRTILVRTDSAIVDSGGIADARVRRCDPALPLAIDTLIATPSGRPVALRLAIDSVASVVLYADGRLLSNRVLRETDAGETALALVVGRYRAVTIDEFHQGYGSESSSATGQALAWSFRSPWGWAFWQLAAVGLLALLADGVRFGPARPVIDRRRRSSLEHVGALATALAAAQGHATAVRLLVRGLRRRLSRTGKPERGDPRPWLEEVAAQARTPAARAAAKTLLVHSTRAPEAQGVLTAANAVEDLWEELKP